MNQLYVHIYPLSWTSLPPPSIPPLSVNIEHQAELPVWHNSLPPAIYLIYVSAILSTGRTFSFPYSVLMLVLRICISTPVLQIGSSVPFF